MYGTCGRRTARGITAEIPGRGCAHAETHHRIACGDYAEGPRRRPRALRHTIPRRMSVRIAASGPTVGGCAGSWSGETEDIPLTR
jgi:hypothetical protein